MAKQWGRWKHRKDNETLEHVNGYYIDLEECGSCAELLDWIFQLTHKAWLTPQDAHDMLRALDEILKPQAKMCSMGVDLTIKPQRVQTSVR